MADMAQLIEPLIPALRRYARSFLKDTAAADDLVQDTLERAISRWHQRRADGNTRTWLFTILHNLAINRLRQTARRGRDVMVETVDEAEVSKPSTQEDGLREADILAAIDRLPEEQRSVLLLISVEDMSYAETAHILAIPIGTVMSRLARARARLLRLLDDPTNSASEGPYLRRVK
jgi:RNA polymerase sigma factor (sigma-70 family)